MAILTSVTVSSLDSYPPLPSHSVSLSSFLHGPHHYPCPTERGTRRIRILFGERTGLAPFSLAPSTRRFFRKPKPSHITSLNNTLQRLPVDLRNSVPVDHRSFLSPPWAAWALSPHRSAPYPEHNPPHPPLLSGKVLIPQGLARRAPLRGPRRLEIWATSPCLPSSGLQRAQQSHCIVTGALLHTHSCTQLPSPFPTPGSAL